MTRIDVFDPPLCCSTGVCGPEVDPALVQFAADLKWFQQQGATVSRHNLAQQPLEFAQNETVRDALQEDDEVLPLVLVDGSIVSRGKYPTAQELAKSVCSSMSARNESPRERAPTIADLAATDSRRGVFSMPAGGCCGGPRTAAKKGTSCCG